jgi:hypothetical protein
MSTGENEQGLRAIIDFTRLLSIALLLVHFYKDCYAAFQEWKLTASVVDNLILNITRFPIFAHPLVVKLSSLLLLAIFLAGIKGRKDVKISYKTAIAYLVPGCGVYFLSHFFLIVPGRLTLMAGIYIGLTGAGYLLMVSGGSMFSRILKQRLQNDIFNDENETFPQEEQLHENDYSVNLPARYRYKGAWRRSWISIINAARMCLIMGSPGAGKTFFLVREIIKQTIEKRKFTSVFIYDFKYPDLAPIAYNSWLKVKGQHRIPPKFYIINFDKPINRCNPIEPSTMIDITDAAESARTMLLGLNMQWIQRTGDFFVESPINFFTAILWYLKKYKDGKFCTIPHAIELMMLDYKDLFPIVSTVSEVAPLLNPFISAYVNRAMEQLEGQVASAKIALARLSSPLLYYVLTGSDFSLDLNNPEDPKMVVLANNPEKTQIYGAVISLYLNRLFRILPKKDMNPCAIIVDEAASFFANGIENFLSFSRGYKIFVYLALQNLNQLRKSYGREQADVIFNLAGNLIVGQSMGDTAKAASEAIGKIVQTRESMSINRQDTNHSRNTQLDYAVPASKISRFSSGEFAGVVADNPDQPIKHKAFHAHIINDPAAINAEQADYQQIPYPDISQEEIQRNYLQIIHDIEELRESELERIKNDPGLAHLLIVEKRSDKQ